ncbi:MAG TPA: hypothetical protein VFQ53_38080 [Kofleriaceae bacterium]|nr:hypothetical protein [Kofleriaceae bacterium]
MNRVALLSCLVLGACAPRTTSYPAPASPPPPSNAGAFHEVQPRQPVVADWFVLGQAVQTGELTQTIYVDGRDPVSQLLVKADSGEPEIEQIEITYSDNQSKRVTLDRKLVAGDGQVIELRERRAIQKIVVYADPDSRGQYTIFGS